jgi:hypothetical protein
MARDFGCGKGLVQDYTQLSKLWAFNNMNGLKICECKEEHKIFGIYLIICDNKRNKILHECCQRKLWEHLVTYVASASVGGMTVYFP